MRLPSHHASRLYALLMSCVVAFIMTAFIANVVVRDDETGFGPIIHSTRISRFDYLIGRFTGAFLAGCLLFLSAPIGMMIGAAMPWLDPETLGAFNFGHYAWVYLLVCVPTLFVTGAGFFAIATATRSMMWTYVGVIGFLVLYGIAAAFLSRPESAQAVALIDPFGTGAYACTEDLHHADQAGKNQGCHRERREGHSRHHRTDRREDRHRRQRTYSYCRHGRHSSPEGH